jgi:hypothetical protein
MTGDETCGVFIPEGVVVGKWRSQWEGRVTGRSGWSHNRLWKGEAYISASAGAGASASGITVVYWVAVSFS